MDLMPLLLALLVVLVMCGVVLTVWDIARRYEASEVAYLNWFLLHFSIGGLGLLAIVLLAALGKLSSEGVGALLGSVIAYSLGAATARSGSAQPQRPPADGTGPYPGRQPAPPAAGGIHSLPVVPFPPVPAPALRPVARPGGRAPAVPPPLPGPEVAAESARFGPAPRVPR